MKAKYAVSYDKYEHDNVSMAWMKVTVYVNTPLQAEMEMLRVRHYLKKAGVKVRNLAVSQNGKVIKLGLTDEQKKRVREKFAKSIVSRDEWIKRTDFKALPVVQGLLKKKKFPFRAWLVPKGHWLAWVIPGIRFDDHAEELGPDDQVGRMMVDGVKRGKHYVYTLKAEPCRPVQYKTIAMNAIMATAKLVLRELSETKCGPPIVGETEDSISFVNGHRMDYDEESEFLLRMASAMRDMWNKVNAK